MPATSRNALCPCHSGLRYKYCCGTQPNLYHRPPLSEDLRLTGLKLQKHGHFVEAINLYDAVLQEHPGDWDVAHMRAVALFQLGLMPESRAAFTTLLSTPATALPAFWTDFDPLPGFLAAHVEYHKLNTDHNAAGIGTGYFPDKLRNDLFARWYEDSGLIFGIAMRSTISIWPKQFFFAGNASIKKAKFDSLSGFNEAFLHDAWDDFEFGLRWAASGGYSQFLPAAMTIHRHAVTLDERCFNMEHAGEAAHVLETPHPNIHRGWKTKLHRHNEPPLSMPRPDAPTQTWIAYYSQRLDQAFARGYWSCTDNDHT